MRRLLLALAILAGCAILVFGTLNILDNQRTRAEIERLRARRYAARLAADSCRRSLTLQEERFRRFDQLVDSLGLEVRELEALDPRGVPEERYDEYMERFNGYNDSVKAWEGRAEALRANEAACRAIVASHNALGDSLRLAVDDANR